MHMQHPFVNRRNTNQYVILKANAVLRMEVDAQNKKAKERAKALGHKKAPKAVHRPITLVGTDISNTRVRYFGHIVRCHKNDPIRRTTLRRSKLKPNYHHKNRAGRPRVTWFHSAAQASWAKARPKLIKEGKVHLIGQRFDVTNRQLRKDLKHAARQRFF